MTIGRALLAGVWSLLLGSAFGALAAFAAETLGLLGLYEIAIGLGGGFGLVVAAQLLHLRQPTLHLLLAGCVATSSLAAQVVVDAWLLHESLVRDVEANGLLLADEAILRGDDDPAGLVDDSLRVDTGVGGLRGAARLRLASGLPVLRVGGQVRALRMPAWLHALIKGAFAAWIAVLCARALSNWRAEPRCPTCDGDLDRTIKIGLREDDAQAVASHWRELETTGAAIDEGPPLPATTCAIPAGQAPVQVLEDRCAGRCGALVGWELRRARGRGLQARAPGPIAQLRRSALGGAEEPGPA